MRLSATAEDKVFVRFIGSLGKLLNVCGRACVRACVRARARVCVCVCFIHHGRLLVT